MRLQPVLDELEGAAEKLSVGVRYESIATTVIGGGLCKIKGEYRVIIDKRASVAERIATLARSLGKLDMSGLSLSAGARSALARYARA